MYDVPIISTLVQRLCAQVQESKLEEVDQHVEEVSFITQSPDSEIDYYIYEVDPSSSNFG